MKIRQKSVSKKRILTVVVIMIAVCGAGIGTYGYYFLRGNQQSKAVIQLDSAKKEKSSPSGVAVNPEFMKPDAAQKGIDGINTTDESGSSHAFPTTQPNLSVSLSELKQSGSVLNFKTKISPAAEGQCGIELTRIDMPAQSSTSPIAETRCTASSMPIESLARGEWVLTIKVTVGQNVATTSSAIILR